MLIADTKIDWDAYMQQVEAFLGGERDYEAIRGDTGPLVYPAGFLYVFTALKLITGGNVLPAQVRKKLTKIRSLPSFLLLLVLLLMMADTFFPLLLSAFFWWKNIKNHWN